MPKRTQAERTKLHNRATRTFTASIMRPVLEAGADPSELAVICESIMLGVGLLLIQYYEAPPPVAAKTLQDISDNAIVRLAEETGPW